jgi:hypothetical protein
MLPSNYPIESFYYQIFLFLQYLGILGLSNGQVVFVGFQYVFYFKVILVFISAFGTFLIGDFLHRLTVIRRGEYERMAAEVAKNLEVSLVVKKNPRWDDVQILVTTGNDASFKLAIIEADKMLDDLLSTLGYQGMTMGDKLLKVEKGDMLSLDEAWEAHKVRNRIAHENDYQLPEREARRVISMYEKVFREYKFI